MPLDIFENMKGREISLFGLFLDYSGCSDVPHNARSILFIVWRYQLHPIGYKLNIEILIHEKGLSSSEWD